MPQTTVSSSMKEITDTLTDLLGHTLSTGVSLLQSLTKSGADIGLKVATEEMKSLQLPKIGSCCQIPPPCWMPKELGEVTSHVCPGGSASLRFRVTNCGMGSRTITAEADQGATISPASIQLGSLQRGWLTVTFTVPAAASNGQSTDILVWIHGCKNYYLRWTVQASNRGCECCHEVDVEDCPDLVHHWYDHFYCVRGCQTNLGHVVGK